VPINQGAGSPDLLTCASPNCQSAPWTYFDPNVAIGYDFALAPSNPADKSIGVTAIRATTKVGNGEYQLYLQDTSGDWIDIAPVYANPNGVDGGDLNVVALLEGFTAAQDQQFGITDPADGLADFSIRGIDPAAGLDPTNPYAFITGLEFSGAFVGDVLITPLVLDTATGIDPPGQTFVDPVPEPGSLPVFGTMLAGLVILLRYRLVRSARRKPPAP
jgi:hypothetical protein